MRARGDRDRTCARFYILGRELAGGAEAALAFKTSSLLSVKIKNATTHVEKNVSEQRDNKKDEEDSRCEAITSFGSEVQ